MILIIDIVVTAAIVYFLLQFFAKIIAEKMVKKPLPKWAKPVLGVISLILAALCFLVNR